MDTIIKFPRHLLLSEGRLIEKTDNKDRYYTPRTIDYKHTIRVITPFSCTHEAEITQLKQTHQKQMTAKEGEIESLKHMITQKTHELDRKNEEIRNLNQIIQQKYQDKLALSNVRNQEKPLIFLTATSNVKFIKNSFDLSRQLLVQELVPDQEPKEDYQIQRIRKEMVNTEQALSNLTNFLQKPRKKYHFYNAKQQQKHRNSQVVNQAKKLDQTDFNLGSSSLVGSSEQQNGSILNMSIDCKSLNDSRDTADFLQDILNEHRILKKTLIDLQQSTKLEMDEQRLYYQNEIRSYIELLSSERQMNNEKYKLNSTRSHIQQEQIVDYIEPFDMSLDKENSFFDQIDESNILDDD